MTQLYWQVYKNLEQEFLNLADTIYINDDQQNVYSMRIADLLIRTVIEIEALAKELYLKNGGTLVPDEEMYFDTVCMKYLDGLWNLDKKVVQVVSPSIYFEKEENKILTPLHKANKRGSSSSDWNKAYQAVKHNRVKELSKGNIKSLLHGLAALYILNLYYRNETINNITAKDRTKINPSFGSSLFTVKIHKENCLKADGTYTKDIDFDECVYIEDHEPNSKQVALDAMKAMSEYEVNKAKEELSKLASARIKQGERINDEWIKSEWTKLMSQTYPIDDYYLSKRITDGLGGMLYDIILNKKQY